MDLYIIITMKDVVYQFSGFGLTEYKKPVLRAYGELGHKFYVQESKNVKRKDSQFVAQHVAQFAFQEGIPQGSLSMVVVDTAGTRRVKNTSDMYQLPFDYVPF
jgi:hypothetical protein